MYKVIANEADFVVIDKSAGVSVHKDDEAQGLIDIIKKDLQLAELYLVHRLDKMTSGLLLLAKNSQSNSLLSQLFQNKEVEKYYIALSSHKPKKKQGLLKGDMEKSRGGNWKLLPSKNNPAITQFFSQSVVPGLRLFMLRPFTGKTHQLRVALKSIAAPILGDKRYSPANESRELDRGYLHSYVLGFTYQNQQFRYCCKPKDGRCFTSPEFTSLLAELENPAEYPWPKLK